MVPCTPHGTPQPAPVHQWFLAVIFVSQGPGWLSCSIPLKKKKTNRKKACLFQLALGYAHCCTCCFLHTRAALSNAGMPRYCPCCFLRCSLAPSELLSPPSSLFTLGKMTAPACPAPLGVGMPVTSSCGVGECLEAGGFQLCQSYSALQLSPGRKAILSLVLVS